MGWRVQSISIQSYQDKLRWICSCIPSDPCGVLYSHECPSHPWEEEGKPTGAYSTFLSFLEFFRKYLFFQSQMEWSHVVIDGFVVVSDAFRVVEHSLQSSSSTSCIRRNSLPSPNPQRPSSDSQPCCSERTLICLEGQKFRKVISAIS